MSSKTFCDENILDFHCPLATEQWKCCLSDKGTEFETLSNFNEFKFKQPHMASDYCIRQCRTIARNIKWFNALLLKVQSTDQQQQQQQPRGSLLEIQNLRSHPRDTELAPTFQQNHRWFKCILKFETHWSYEPLVRILSKNKLMIK